MWNAISITTVFLAAAFANVVDAIVFKDCWLLIGGLDDGELTLTGSYGFEAMYCKKLLARPRSLSAELFSHRGFPLTLTCFFLNLYPPLN